MTLLLCTHQAHAQIIPGLEVEGYAEFNYQRFSWDTDSTRRARIDLERAAIEASYKLSDRITLEAEVEFEHGGTGGTMEFDRFEEFGEYEQETEKGGEVVIEKLAVVFSISDYANIRAGHIYVPVGLVNSHYEPGDYFTVTRSESEMSLIPATWHETGVEVFGRVGGLKYRGLVVNGLDATGFSSATWIMRGAQGRFEYVNAENLAFVLRADYSFNDEMFAGGSVYAGNSADNRPKPDMKVPATVTIGEAHVAGSAGPVTARAQVMYGQLQNSEAVSIANRNLSNNLNVKRTPVGAAALAWYVEAGVDVLKLFAPGTDAAKHGNSAVGAEEEESRLDLFGRYDFYDTMFGVQGNIFDNPRWERNTITAGVNYRPIEDVVVKAQYSQRTLGIPSANKERTFALGLGLEF